MEFIWLLLTEGGLALEAIMLSSQCVDVPQAATPRFGHVAGD